MTLWWWVLFGRTQFSCCFASSPHLLKTLPWKSHFSKPKWQKKRFPLLRCVVLCFDQFELVTVTAVLIVCLHQHRKRHHPIFLTFFLRVLQLEPSSHACLLLNYSPPPFLSSWRFGFPFRVFSRKGMAAGLQEPDSMQILHC